MTVLYVFMAVLAAWACICLLRPLAAGAGAPRAASGDRLFAAAIALLLPAASLSLYLMTGRPDLPAHPAARDLSGEMALRQAALLARRPMAVITERNPDDVGAHASLAELNRRIGRHEEEVSFLARAVALAAAADAPSLYRHAVALGQAQVRLNAGIVGEDAQATFAFVQKLAPGDPVARHFEALALAQRGAPDEALAIWRALLSEKHPSGAWKDMARRAMKDARRD
jgi:cytochrome c-type biogenesis protein CcmH